MHVTGKHLLVECLWALTMSIVAACGGGGGGTPPPRSLGISVTQPSSTGNVSSNCNTIELQGNMDLGVNAGCCAGTTVEQLTDDTITWKNETSGASGTASQTVNTCGFFEIVVLCDPTWKASVPLVVGNNRIRVDVVDSGGAKGEAVLNVNKSGVGYFVSGKVTSDAGISLSPPPSSVYSRLVMNWTGAVPFSTTNVNSDGTFSQACLIDGTYSINPSSTINYAFAPASRTVTIAGADVTGQDFTAPAWKISGTVTWASSGSPALLVTVGLSGSGSTATYLTGDDGQYSFLVPNGSYTITPSDLPSTLFVPSNRSITIAGSDVASVDFTRQ